MYIGIDLSLRSTGLCSISDSVNYILITSDSKSLNDEELIAYNTKEICNFIEQYKPSYIGIEGLSFNSLSSSKDLIAGNFWHLRTTIFERFPDITVDIIPVLSWRNPLFSKEEKKTLKENEAKVKLLKKEIMKASKEEKKTILSENYELFNKTNIKYLTWEKIADISLKEEFKMFGFNKGCFDLTDSYFIAKHIQDKYL